jgi:hypothetical protein
MRIAMVPTFHLTRTASILGIAIAASFPCDHAISQSQSSLELARQEISQKLGLHEVRIQALEIAGEDGGSRQVFNLDLDGRVWSMNLRPYSMRGLGFQLLTAGRHGALQSRPAPPLRTYRGTLEGLEQARVAASINHGRLTAHIFDGQSTWWIQPLTIVEPKADPRLHVIFKESELVPEDWTCGTEDVAAPQHGDGGIAGGTAPPDCLFKAQIA